jgi:hypothetical protein
MTLAVASHPRAKFVGQLSWLTSFQRETANVPSGTRKIILP